jgi:HEAT repeat protein
MKKAAGYIMNTEGRTSSVAIMAREWETPTVTGTIGEGEESTQLLKTGQRVIVDGTVGAVFEHVKERSKFCLDLGIEEFSAYKASENVAGLIKALKFAKSQLFKTEAIDILVKIGSPKVVKSLAAILRDEKEADEARPNTAKALGKIASDGAIIALMTTLGDWFGVIREGVSQVLAEVGEPAIVPLISALNSGNPFAQEGAANALFSIGTSDYRIELFNAVLEIKTEEGFRLEDAKKNAIEGLVKIADKKAVESLIAVVENIKEDSEIREKAVHALGKIKDSRAVEVLISAATEDADYSIRCWSASALGDIGDIRAVEALLALLQDKIGRQEMRLRGHAAEALGKIGDNRILEPFIKVLEDNREHEFVRRCAAWSLLQLDDDRAALPLIKYFKKNLDAVSNLKPLQYDISKSVGDTT